MMIIRDPVDDLLKADAAEHRHQYLEDDGFTLRVLDVLPKHARISSKQRIAIPLAFATLAALFVVFFTGGGNFIVDGMMDIATSSATPSAFGFGVLFVVFAVSSLVAARDN